MKNKDYVNDTYWGDMDSFVRDLEAKNRTVSTTYNPPLTTERIQRINEAIGNDPIESIGDPIDYNYPDIDDVANSYVEYKTSDNDLFADLHIDKIMLIDTFKAIQNAINAEFTERIRCGSWVCTDFDSISKCERIVDNYMIYYKKNRVSSNISGLITALILENIIKNKSNGDQFE